MFIVLIEFAVLFQLCDSLISKLICQSLVRWSQIAQDPMWTSNQAVCVCACVCMCVYSMRMSVCVSICAYLKCGVQDMVVRQTLTASMFFSNSPSHKRLYPEEDLKHVKEKVNWTVLLEDNTKHYGFFSSCLFMLENPWTFFKQFSKLLFGWLPCWDKNFWGEKLLSNSSMEPFFAEKQRLSFLPKQMGSLPLSLRYQTCAWDEDCESDSVITSACTLRGSLENG